MTLRILLMAMLGTTQVVAMLVCRSGLKRVSLPGAAWPLALAFTGALLLLLR